MSKITFGVKNMHYAIKNTNPTTGAITYGTPVVIPGAYEISMPPVGETKPIYADNIVYAQIMSNQGYEGNIGCYGLPDSFRTDCLGEEKNTKGVFVESSKQKLGEFALLGELDSDTADTKRFVFWNCTASRPDFASKTKEESPEANQLSLPIKASPLPGTETIRGTITGDGTNTTWAGWFANVYIPTAE